MPHNLMRNGEMYLYGYVGETYWDEGFTASQVLDALAEVGSADLVVHVNSGGGYVRDGVAIYNALKTHDGTVTIHIDALAASAASVIAMAGDKIEMGEGALMMIHNASGMTIGTHEDHDKTSEQLRLIDKQAAAIYARRTGQTEDAVAKMMDEETWMGVDEAIANGFADAEEGTVAEPTAFDYRIYQNAPERLAAMATQRGWAFQSAKPATPVAPKKEHPHMAGKPNNPVPGNKTAGTNPNPGAAPATADVDAIAAEATQKEMDRQDGIRKTAAVMGIDDAERDKMIKGQVSLEDARSQMIDLAAAKQHAEEGDELPAGQVKVDAREKFMVGASLAVMERAGIEGGERNEFTGLTLKEIARESLIMLNLPARGMDPMKLIGQAFMSGGQHGTSDFGNILADVAYKSMMIGFGEAEEVFDKLARKGSLTDFKPSKRVDIGMFDDLVEVPEGAEYKYGTVGDRGESIQLATYGRMLSLTRQLVINDDLDALSRIPRKMGRAAKRTVGNLFWAVYTANPTMSDGVALFHANHKNLASSGAAPSVATLSAGKKAMRLQKDPDSKSKTGLNIRAKYLIVPVALEDVSNTLITSKTDPAKQNSEVPNIHKDTLEVISDARLDESSAVEWFMAADPQTTDTIEVAYLDGNDEPYMEQRQGWSVDGTDLKVRLDAGVKPLDFRGQYKNPGA